LILSSLTSALPDKYDLDYLVYNSSDNVLQEEIIWNTEITQLYKRLLLRKFDNWIKEQYQKSLEMRRNG
jgi:hypothetical protein